MATCWVNNQATGGSNDGTSEASGFLTIDQAMNWVATAGAGSHTIWIKGGANYQGVNTIDTLGGITSLIYVEGYTDITGDGGMVTIDQSSLYAEGFYISSSSSVFYVFRNITVMNSTSWGWNFTTSDYYSFENCHAEGCASGGFFGDNNNKIYKCTATNNGGNGFDFDTGGDYIFCEAHNNSGHGIMADGGTFYCCVASGNTGIGMYGINSGTFINCTVDGKGLSTAGIGSGSYYGFMLFNNIIHNCEDGIDGAELSRRFGKFGGYNLISNSTVMDYNDWDNTTGDIIADANFVDVTNGDYRLSENSPARNAGLDARGTTGSGMDIGAYQSTDKNQRIVLIS